MTPALGENVDIFRVVDHLLYINDFVFALISCLFCFCMRAEVHR